MRNVHAGSVWQSVDDGRKAQVKAVNEMRVVYLPCVYITEIDHNSPVIRDLEVMNIDDFLKMFEPAEESS